MNSQALKNIFSTLSKELESGPDSEFFTDPRGGFANTLACAELALEKGKPDSKSRKCAIEYIEKCRNVLSCVQESGWDVVTRRVSKEHASKMINHRW